MTPEMTLYDYELSADCYQARLMLALLGLSTGGLTSSSTPAASTSRSGSRS